MSPSGLGHDHRPLSARPVWNAGPLPTGSGQAQESAESTSTHPAQGLTFPLTPQGKDQAGV